MLMFRLFVSGLVVLMLAETGGAQPAAAAQQDGRGPAASEPGEPAPEPTEAEAVESAIAEQEADIAELERRIAVLAEEVERLRSGEPEIEITVEQARALGLAPSAAATYGIERGVSIAGYGEMLLENYAADKTTQFDYLRLILYAGYRFNDKFIFNSEIEVEHANEIYVEFAYVDWLARDDFGVRGGMLLVPMGLVNEFHEPNVFIGAERPVTEQAIIPSTWRENGGGVYGSAGDMVAYRAYVVNGLKGERLLRERRARRAAEGRQGPGRGHGVHGPRGYHADARRLLRRQLLRRRFGAGSTSTSTASTTACAPASSTCTARRSSAASTSARCMRRRISTTRPS